MAAPLTIGRFGKSLITLVGGCAILLPAGSARGEVQNADARRLPAPSDQRTQEGLTEGDRVALAQDVERPYRRSDPVYYGHYEYVPQKHVYSEFTWGTAYQDVQSGISAVWEGSETLNRMAGFHTTGTLGNFTLSGNFGLSGFNLPRGGLFWGGSGSLNENGYLSLALGPFVLDRFYAGYGALYSDINGNYPNLDLLPPDDRWAHIVWLSFRATLLLGDSLAISLQPMVYWLPAKGKVGWGIPGPLAGIMAPQLMSSALLRLSYAQDLGNWQLTFYDQFSPFLLPYNIWDVAVNTNMPFFGDLTPIDRVGRYGFGYGAGDMASYDPTARFGLRDSDGWDGWAGFYNMAGARAYGTHGYSLRSMVYLDRIDMWNRNFVHGLSILNGGAYLQNQAGNLTTYIGYNFSHLNIYDTWVNSAVAGFRKQTSPYFIFYGETGYAWISGPSVRDNGAWIGLAGVQNRLGIRTMQKLEGGRRVSAWLFNAAPRLEDYLEYRLTHQLGARGSLSLFAGVAERKSIVRSGDDQEYQYAGALANFQISTRLNSFANVGWEKGLSKYATGRTLEWERWLYRLGLMYVLTEDIQSHCYYQYEDVHGNPFDYTEHMLYLGIVKRF